LIVILGVFVGWSCTAPSTPLTRGGN